MSKPLVAVVTPTLNGARYLAETMESVQSQTWPNLIHVVLDNNSTDDTPKIIDSFRGGPVPILYFRNDETLPQRANWNKAFSHVPDEVVYVRLLCDDDTMPPQSIAKMAELAETDPEIGAVGGFHFCCGEVVDLLWPANRQVYGGLEAIRMALLREGVMVAPHMLWRKSISDRCKPLFGDYITGGSFDLDTVFQMLTMSKFGFVHENLGFTRVHNESVTTQNFGYKTRYWTREGLEFLTKYGPLVFGDEYPTHLKRFRNYYIRRMLVWRKVDGGEEGLGIHYAALEQAGWKFNRRFVADALVDWLLVKVGIRQNWKGYPGWQ